MTLQCFAPHTWYIERQINVGLPTKMIYSAMISLELIRQIFETRGDIDPLILVTGLVFMASASTLALGSLLHKSTKT